MSIGLVQLLFTNLSKRLDSETNLSDFTWAVCETNPEFKRLFVEYFFTGIGNAPDIVLEREYYKKSSRPDFRFKHENQEYIIEVKKYDGNDHFEQYLTDFPEAEIGWIANYQQQEHANPRLHIRTWKGYNKILQEYLKKNSEAEGTIIVDYYCTYLESVCSLIKIKTMRLDNLSSLLSFNEVVKDLIDRNYNEIMCREYYSAVGVTESRYGSFFTLKRETVTKEAEIYGWFGVGFESNSTWIGVFFSKEWGGKIHDKYKDGTLGKNATYFIKPEKESNLLWFKLQSKHFLNFNQENDPEVQNGLLISFFHEVLDAINDCII